MYAMNIHKDVIGLVLREICKSKQVTDFITWPSRCHGRIHETEHARYMQSSTVSVRKNWLLVQILAGSWLSKLAPGDFSGSYFLGARAAPVNM